MGQHCSMDNIGLVKRDSAFQYVQIQIIIPIHKVYSRLSLSQIPRDSLKHFEISILQHIRVAEVRKTINQTITCNK